MLQSAYGYSSPLRDGGKFMTLKFRLASHDLDEFVGDGRRQFLLYRGQYFVDRGGGRLFRDTRLPGDSVNDRIDAAVGDRLIHLGSPA